MIPKSIDAWRRRALRRFIATASTSAALLCAPAGLLAQTAPGASEPSPLYDSKGKRDPFISLRGSVENEAPTMLQPPPLVRRPPGLAGLLIDEVSVAGLVAGRDSTIAVLKGVDGFTYFAKKGDGLFDGLVESIEGEEVAFRRLRKDTRGRSYTAKITKRLNSPQITVEEEKEKGDEREEP